MDIDDININGELLFNSSQQSGRYCDPVKHNSNSQISRQPKFHIPLTPLTPISKPIAVSPRPSSPSSPRNPIVKSPRKNRNIRKDRLRHSIAEQLHLREMQDAIREIEVRDMPSSHIRKVCKFDFLNI